MCVCVCVCVWLCVFIIFFCSYSGDPLDQGYFPVGESLNILNTNTNINTKSYLPFCTENGPKLTCGRVFQHNFISKANLKNPEQGF